MKMDSKELIKKICDEWHFALLGDLEQSDEEAYLKFGEFLSDLENEIG